MGPLAGLKIVEFAGIGAGPHCAMMLAEMGASVIRVDRPAPSGLGVEIETAYDLLLRSRPSVAIDLKGEAGRDVALRLIGEADALLESFRPGVMERNGLGPEVCLARNPRLVYARLTGWGQTGPYSQMAGHDINYIAVTGALAAIGPREGPPQLPLNLLGDFAGGGLTCALGMVSALLHAQRTGEGQVIDVAMADGVTTLMTMIVGFRGGALWSDNRCDNIVDGGAPYYSTYETADGRWVAIGAIEAKFYEALLDKLGLCDVVHMRPQNDRRLWPQQRETFAAAFREKTRDQWSALLEGTDACFAPVLTLDEAPDHPHLRARNAYVQVNNVEQPAPQPRFSRTPAQIRGSPALPGEHTVQVLRDWGWCEEEIRRDLASGAVFQAERAG